MMKIPSDIEKKRILLGNKSIADNEAAFHIGYGTDENFVMPMGISIVSVLENNQTKPVAFHVLTEHISEESKNKLEQIVEKYPQSAICIHCLDLSVLDGLPVFSSLGKAAYIRIFLDQILPQSLDRILYLDGDIICLGDLEELSKKSFEKAAVMVVKDKPDTAQKQEAKFHVSNYFNSGMLYINLSQWKEHHIPEQFLDVCFTYKKQLNHLDQDALNIVLQDQKLILDERYNYIPDADEIIDRLPKGTLFLHYAGTKPWYCWLKFPMQKYFYEYYGLSPWKELSLTQPRNYREMHYMSRYYRKAGKPGASFYWLVRYLAAKAKTKL